MLSDQTKDALNGLLLNIEAIADFIKRMTLEQFTMDVRTVYAVTRALDIISEASRRLPDELKSRYPKIRWRAIRDAGNVYRHIHGKVSAAYVWDTAVQQLENLRQIVAHELNALGGSQQGLSGINERQGKA